MSATNDATAHLVSTINNNMSHLVSNDILDCLHAQSPKCINMSSSHFGSSFPSPATALVSSRSGPSLRWQPRLPSRAPTSSVQPFEGSEDSELQLRYVLSPAAIWTLLPTQAEVNSALARATVEGASSLCRIVRCRTHPGETSWPRCSGRPKVELPGTRARCSVQGTHRAWSCRPRTTGRGPRLCKKRSAPRRHRLPQG